MPLFRCQKCGCVENTAPAWWWYSEGKLCTECKTGKWHGLFSKYSAVGMLEDENGFLYTKSEVKEGGYFYGHVKDGRVKIVREILE